MTKRQTRLFFVIGTTLFAAIFVGLTIHSHMKFAELTHADAITPDVIAGKHVWHRKNCINCHTLLGEGAYYAPDLTKITQQRGDVYLRQFLQDPSRFYSEERHGRLMPNMRLSDQQITELIAFLTWVSNIDNQNWPPRPIVVSAALPQGTGAARGTGIGEPGRPRAKPCSAGRPRPASAATRLRKEWSSSDRPWPAWRRARRRSSPARTTKARRNRRQSTSANRSSSPQRYVVPGPTFSAGGLSVMPPLARS